MNGDRLGCGYAGAGAFSDMRNTGPCWTSVLTFECSWPWIAGQGTVCLCLVGSCIKHDSIEKGRRCTCHLVTSCIPEHALGNAACRWLVYSWSALLHSECQPARL